MKKSLHSVVFFRAANVGGHQVFQPGVLAKNLLPMDVVNLGAAGTFVVRKNVSAGTLRAEILRHLPFKPEMIICPAADVLALLSGNYFRDTPAGEDIGRFLTILQKVPRTVPAFPVAQPPGAKWEVQLIAQSGRFVLSVRRRGKTYSNPVVEKLFGIPATTRSWNTIEAIGKILAE